MFDEKEIQRLLRLSTIKNYILLPKEKEMLEAWKAQQVETPMPKKTRKSYKNKVEKVIGEIEES